MRSKVNLIRKTEEEKEKKTIQVEPGDILLVKRHNITNTVVKREEEFLVRVFFDNGYALAKLGGNVIFDIDKADYLYTGNKYITTGGSELEILGICDIDITIKDIRCYE